MISVQGFNYYHFSVSSCWVVISYNHTLLSSHLLAQYIRLKFHCPATVHNSILIGVKYGILVFVFVLQESAMFVCIVMDYYKQGDLGHVLRQKREIKEALDELVSHFPFLLTIQDKYVLFSWRLLVRMENLKKFPSVKCYIFIHQNTNLSHILTYLINITQTYLTLYSEK